MQINRGGETLKIVKNPQTSHEILREIYNNITENIEAITTSDIEILNLMSRNPNTPVDILKYLVCEFFDSVIANPKLADLAVQDAFQVVDILAGNSCLIKDLREVPNWLLRIAYLDQYLTENVAIHKSVSWKSKKEILTASRHIPMICELVSVYQKTCVVEEVNITKNLVKVSYQYDVNKYRPYFDYIETRSGVDFMVGWVLVNKIWEYGSYRTISNKMVQGSIRQFPGVPPEIIECRH